MTMASPKTLSRRPAASARTYRSVDEMLRGHGYRQVADAVRQLSAKTKLIDQLIVARVAAGLTQAQMAAKLEVDAHALHVAIEAAVREHLMELGELRARVD